MVVVRRAVHNTFRILGVFRPSKGMAYLMGDGMSQHPGLGVWVRAGAGARVIFGTLLGS